MSQNEALKLRFPEDAQGLLQMDQPRRVQKRDVNPTVDRASYQVVGEEAHKQKRKLEEEADATVLA